MESAAAITLDRPPTRAERMKQATSTLHARLDENIVAKGPFLDRDRYRRFVEVQFRFTAAIEPLYGSEYHGRIVPGLAGRSRLNAARLDLGDLERAPPPVDALPIGRHEGLGWLYVSEGSTLGAAFLLKAVEAIGYNEQFGARHLAAAPAGRGRHWRDFTAALNAVELSPEDDARAVIGAIAAFEHVRMLVGEAFVS